jgi:hypothetical protein
MERLQKAVKESILERLRTLRDDAERLRLFRVAEVLEEAIAELSRRKSSNRT